MVEEIQRKLNIELDKFKLSTKELQKLVSTRQQLDGQLNENNVVQSELNLLASDANVFKSIGPVLIKTELVEAKQNVSKRIEFISKELKRLDEQITGVETKQDQYRQAIQKLQEQLQQAEAKL